MNFEWWFGKHRREGRAYDRRNDVEGVSDGQEGGQKSYGTTEEVGGWPGPTTARAATSENSKLAG